MSAYQYQDCWKRLLYSETHFSTLSETEILEPTENRVEVYCMDHPGLTCRGNRSPQRDHGRALQE